MKRLLVSALLLCGLLGGCADPAKNFKQPTGKLVQGENGMAYVITCVEGREFIATQAAYGYWMLSGPIGLCGSK